MSEFSSYLIEEGYKHTWWPDPGGHASRLNVYTKQMPAATESAGRQSHPAGKIEVSARTQLTYEPHSCEVSLVFRLQNGLTARTVVALPDPQKLPEMLSAAIERLKAGAAAMVQSPP